VQQILKRRNMQNSERNTKMLTDRRSGMTYIALGEKYDVTPGRVRQICKDLEYKRGLEENPLYVLCGKNKSYLRALHRVNVNTLDELKEYVAAGCTAPRGIGISAFTEIVKRL
jgi:hypothetical protein